MVSSRRRRGGSGAAGVVLQAVVLPFDGGALRSPGVDLPSPSSLQVYGAAGLDFPTAGCRGAADLAGVAEGEGGTVPDRGWRQRCKVEVPRSRVLSTSRPPGVSFRSRAVVEERRRRAVVRLRCCCRLRLLAGPACNFFVSLGCSVSFLV
jgi:hypothetical protein